MPSENIIYEKKDTIASITLNRPEKLNALSEALLHEFDAALDQAEHDKEVRVLVLKGAGRAFCAGYDASEIGVGEASPTDWRTKPYATDLLAVERQRQGRLQRLFNYPKSTIAQVHGYCLEAGCYLSMSCDLTIAAEDALFGDPSVRMGRVSATPLWYYIMGLKKAKEFLFTGKTVDSQTAETIGLVTEVVPRAHLEARVDALADAIAKIPFDGLQYHREGFQLAVDARGLAAGWRFAGEMHMFSCFQRPAPGEFNFLDVRDKKGLKAAFEEMNAPFKAVGL